MIANCGTIDALLRNGELIVGDIRDSLGEASLTLHFGTTITKYQPDMELDALSNNLQKQHAVPMSRSGYVLEPGEFVLIFSKEKVRMPKSHLGYLVTRTSLAKLGVQVHISSPHVDPGVELHVTFEVKNSGNNPVRIYPEMPAAKIFFFALD